MKIYSIATLLLSANFDFGLASRLGHGRDLQDADDEGCADCCTTIAELDFPNIKFCTDTIIGNKLTAVLNTTDCDHNKDIEGALLTGNNIKKSHKGRVALRKECQTQIKPCIENVDELLEGFETLKDCQEKTIRNRIADFKPEGCTRDARSEGILLAPSEYSVWVDKKEKTLNAADYFIAECQKQISACAKLDLLVSDFPTIEVCDRQRIEMKIKDLQEMECCKRASASDGLLLAQELVRAEGESKDIPNRWTSSDPEIATGSSILINQCQDLIQPCMKLEDLDFTNLNSCSENSILDEIHAKQEGCASKRSAKQNALLMTGTKVWNSDDADQTKALDILTQMCEDKITPCTSLDTLDFSYISSCSENHILNLIEDTRREMGDACPSTETRSVLKEVALIDGGLDKLEETCKAKVKSCTLREGDSLEVNGCDWIHFKKAVREAMGEDGSNCKRELDFEIHALDQELADTTGNGIEQWISKSCNGAWNTFDTSTFSEVDTEFDDAFMGEYVDGKTHLNEETGNFQGNCVYGRNSEVGANIAAFRMEKAEETIMQGFDPLKTCTIPAMMCCFGRDRQFGDNNGNCEIDDCDDADPADNSNLCKTNTREYPNDDPPENDIHCHGLAWGEDPNDFSRKLMFNNLFYVSLYDHMYTRGYVEKMIRDDPDNFGMCGCMESMPPVTRSDCTEVVVNPFVITRAAKGITVAAPENLDVTFNACRGIGRSNDLSTHIKRLVRDGRMSEEHRDAAWNHLVGYENPNNNNNEAACEAIL